MEKRSVKTSEHIIEYTLNCSKRARNIGISIDCEAGVIATKPWFISIKTLEQFILQKQSWIFKHLNKFSKLDFKPFPKINKREYKKYKVEIKKDVVNILEKYNQVYNFTYRKVFIKNQRTRWGSCSIRKNLNLNYRIKFLPQPLKEYIVVHELCHLKEFNHSKRFWNLVKETVPEYKNIRKELKKYHL